MQEEDNQDGRLYESPRVGEPAHAKPAITPNAKFTSSVANKRGELPVFDQSNALWSHASQPLRENDDEMMSEEMDLDQVTAAVEGKRQLQPDRSADISQLLEESQQCAQFSEDLRVKLLLGNMVRAPSATVVYYSRV